MAALLHLALVWTTVRGVGLVGEVAAAWALATPPRVLVDLHPPAEGLRRVGPIELRETRPTASLVLGSARLPLAVNAYTGGPADWPARAARALTGDWRAGPVVHVALGLLLLALVHRFLRFHATDAAAGAAALVLAADWSFVYYRKVLGGTEVLLQAAGLLVLWALWSRRWRGGVHGTVAVAVGVGLGLLAKLTFGATLAAVALTAWLMRWDRAALKPPEAVNPWVLAGIPVVLTSPLWGTALLRAGDPGPHVVSHDTLALQLARLGQPTPDRETWANLVSFLGNPLSAFAPALGADPEPPLSALRVLALLTLAAGTWLAWRRQDPSPAAALLRFVSVLAPAQTLALFAANRDLHHLAQSTPTWAIWLGLAADRVAGEWAPPRSPLRGVLAALGVLPAVCAGVLQLRGTDAVLATAPRSTFTRAGQEELVGMLRAAGVRRLVTSDYEVYGMIEVLAPEVDTLHTWGAISRGGVDRAAIVGLAEGGHYLSLRPTAPMIYDWSPRPADLARVTEGTPWRATLVEQLEDREGAWATLYRVDRAD